MNTSEFAQSLRAKYPGTYDNLEDQDLVSKVVAKYPQYQSQLSDYKPADPASEWDRTKALVNAMPGYVGHIGRELINAPQDLFNQVAPIKTALYDIPKDLLNLPRELAANPDPRETSLGKFTTDATQGMAQGLTNLVKNPVKTEEENPVSTGLTIAGLGAIHPQAGGIEGELGSFAEDLKNDSSLAKFNKKLLGVSESATKMGGRNLPVPSNADIEAGVDNVIKAHQDVVNSFGEDLNDAKAKAGLPVTEAEKSDSIRKFGNKRNLDLSKPLELPPDAPKGLNPGDTVTLQGKDLPDQQAVYKGPLVGDSADFLRREGISEDTIAKMRQPSWDISEDLPDHPKGSTLAHDTLEKAGYQMPDPNKGPMPYKITPSKTPEELNTEIDRFMKNQDFISNTDKIKAASHFQDRIKNYVPDFSQEGDETQGILKSKYQQLKDVISGASPELQQAKSNFGQMKEALNLISENIDPERPGKTQDFLKRIFTSTTEAANDQRQQLAYLEQLSGQPVVSNLFKQFAGKEFGQFVGPTGERLIKKSLPYAVGGGLLGHPGVGAGALGMEAALTSPRLMGNLEAGVPAALKTVGPSAALESAVHGAIKGAMPGNKRFATPALQSLKDRLKNAKSE